MPIDYKKYPDNWKTEIRPSILKRAGGSDDDPRVGAACEECKTPNYAVGYWHVIGFVYESYEVFKSYRAASKKRDWYNLIIPEIKTVVIVLTISHTDHDITNNDPSNLRALCQRCHNAHDAEYRAKNRKKNNAENSGQLALI